MSRQFGQLYINIKRAAGKLKLDEVKKAEETVLKKDMQYTFKRNSYLGNLLLKCNAFGDLNITANLATRVNKKTFDNLIHKEELNVERNSHQEQNDCFITGSAVLLSNKLVLASYYSSKLKIVDTKSKEVTKEKTFYSGPFDIADIARDRIAVTMPDQRKILVMLTSSHLSVVRIIQVKGACYGITYRQGYLYVVCRDPKSVLVLDTTGNVQNSISLNNDIFQYPEYIELSEDSKLIYISDCGSGRVVSITLQGAISGVYKHYDLIDPQGMLMLDDGSLLVCSSWNGIIHHISGDLKQGQTVKDGIPWPRCISYSHHDEELYIGGEGNLIKVFYVK